MKGLSENKGVHVALQRLADRRDTVRLHGVYAGSACVVWGIDDYAIAEILASTSHQRAVTVSRRPTIIQHVTSYYKHVDE